MSEETRANVSRRGLLQILGATTAGAAFAEAPGSGQHVEHAPTVKKEAFSWRVFDSHQRKTVSVLSDLTIPADDRSCSASQAGVTEFMDDWIAFRTEEDGHDRLKAEVLGGLMWLDRESNGLFGADFVDASAAQHKQILDRIAWPERAAKEDSQWSAFFSTFRDLVVSGFFSSKPGVADLPYLGNTAVAEWKGCDPKVWAVIEQRMKDGYQGLVNGGTHVPGPGMES